MALMDFTGILLVSDLDGTLLDSKSRLSLQNQTALQHFVRHGGLFTIATGRMEKTIRSYLPMLPINVPGILYNGAVIYDFASQKAIWENYLAEEMKMVVRDLQPAFPDLGIEVYHGMEVYFLQQNDETEKHCIRDGLRPLVRPVEQMPFPWIKVMLAAKATQLAAVEAYLKFRPGRFRMVYSESYFLELLPPDISKGRALKELVRYLGVPNLKVVALGDNLNDLEMIQTADLGIAVANAHPRLQQAAKLCYAHHDDHVIAQVVNHLEQQII